MNEEQERIEKAFLTKRYLEERRTLRQIAEECQVAITTVHRRLVHYDIPRREGRPPRSLAELAAAAAGRARV